jgi:5-methylcytosine-specific restriction endonuclease McrBC regulatory subunit McrC
LSWGVAGCSEGEASPFYRKEKANRKALNLARLIIENDNPVLNQGKNNINALIFDMNALFEKYFVYFKPNLKMGN